MRVDFSARAEADLESIGDWIAGDNPPRALSFVSELREACEGLPPFPRAFPTLSRFPNVHRRLYGNYLIFYRVGVEDILILAILHGASDYENVLADLL